MRVLVACNVYPPNFVGGAELIAHQQAKALQRLGHEVEVFAGETHPFGEHHELRRELWDGIAVNRISMLPRDYEPGFVNFSHPTIERHFDAVLAKFRPDILHAHNLVGLSAALPHLARRRGVPSVVTLHDHWGYCFKNTIIKSGTTVCDDFSRCAECMPVIDDGAGRGIPVGFRRDFIALMLDQVDAFISPSQYLADSYVKAGFAADRIHVVWNGIDVRRFKAVERKRSSQLRLTYVGILAPHKGVQTLMQALGHLPADANVVVNVVGADVGMLPAYQAILAANGRSHQVRFRGRIDPAAIQDVYAETDVLVLPSIWPENQPVSITEAMSCGIPAIVSNMGGMLELVEDGVSGDVFRAGDPADLAAKIEAYVRDAARAERFGRSARSRIEAHSFDDQVKKLLGLYGVIRDGFNGARSPGRLVACIGRRIDAEAADTAQFLASQGWRIVMREWLTPELASAAVANWLADPEMSWADARPFAASGPPLLADIRNKDRRTALHATRSVLFCGSRSQAAKLLQKLAGDEATRAQLGSRIAQLAAHP